VEKMARRPNPELRSLRKKELIDSIVNIINENSISNTTTRKIASEADLTIASLHYYFGSKDGALVETAKFILEYWIKKILERPGELKDKIIKLFEPSGNMAAFSQIITYPYRSKITIREIKDIDDSFTMIIKDVMRSKGYDVDSSFTAADILKTFLIGLGFKGFVYPELIEEEVLKVVQFLETNKIS
jgi:AcrR family transcriptional regulator